MRTDLQLFASKVVFPAGLAEGENFSLSALALPKLTGAAEAFLALALGDITLVVTSGIPDADRVFADLELLTSIRDIGVYSTRVMMFPPLLDGDRGALGARLKVVAALKAYALRPYPLVIVAPYAALVTPVGMGEVETLVISTEAPIEFKAVAESLSRLGYSRVAQVSDIGEYSVRGGIIDAWGPDEEFPVRAEFFGEELESVRIFDPATQISIERRERAELLPVKLGSDGDEVEKRGGDEVESGGLLELFPDGAHVLALDHNEYALSSVTTSLKRLRVVYTGDPAPSGVPTGDLPTAPLPGFAELGADEAHHPELFDAARRRLEQHLAAAEKRGDRILKIDELSGGFELPGFIVVTKADRVFAKRGKRERRITGAAALQGPRLNDFDDLEPGEYVVHIDYGVGRFIGSKEILLDGKRNEVYTIEYADGGKLHVPAAHAHLLSRYVGVKGEEVHLHRLDGKRWAKDKENAEKAVGDLAAALLETQAKRDTVPGFAYEIACDGREAFDAAFPYTETADQLSAIAAIEKDLAARKPMDRLVCGDAGYGKTEVAMRAAYIAAMNGKQVAVLAPTTVLAEQHFETFTSRFDGTPVRIESVSRFQSALTHRGTFQRIATGVCDIVIGTHAILSDKIAFHDLGLIIIDEEQRFGVRHKEFLKRLRATADVLTLSATPIPRTLYLSMTGARDLSLLRSPPRERVAVDTRIVRDSDDTIRAAIEAELNRGGQVFFLHNRVNSIHTVEKRLKEIFHHYPPSPLHSTLSPRIVVAHGQMEARELAKKMRAFERGEYDLLLSTTIIESGIDIPRANTIIVSQTETFGMADLYQLRGRVGRSSREGHAYFLLPPSGVIDSDARERLEALKRHGGLGSGFNLAVRDLELRGAGNLLGSQQSGHIAAVGFGLYCQLLQRTIARLKGEKVKEIVDVKLNLDFVNPRLPYEYIEEDVQRLSLMKRFAEAQDVKIVRALAAEMKDRFGPLPPEAKEFVSVAELRVRTALAGYSRIDARGDRAVLYRPGSPEIAKVMDLKGRPGTRLRLLLAFMKGFVI